MANLNQFNLENMCRTCRSVGELKSLYNTASTTDICLAEMLMLCTPVEFYNDDELPKQICQDCIQEVVRSYNFALKCKESNEMWRECLNSIKKLKSQPFQIQEMIKIEPDIDVINNTTQSNITADTLDVTSLYDDGVELQADEIKIEEHYYEITDEINSKVDPFENNADRNKAMNELNSLQTCWLPVVVLNKLPNNNGACAEPELKKKTNTQLEHKKAISTIALESNNIIASSETSVNKRDDEKYDFRNRNLPKLSINYCETFESDDEFNPNEVFHSTRQSLNKSTKTVALRCYICRRRFKSKARLENHLKPCRSTSLKCPKCPRLFHSEANLKRHLKIHDGRILFLCKVCKNPFSNRSNLIVHLRTHTGEMNKVACTVCNRNYVRTFLSINGEFQCKVCRKRPNLLENNHHHPQRKRKAAGDVAPMYSCAKCLQRFHSLAPLTAHSKQHSGEPLFACSICNAQFAKTIPFSAHVQTHFKRHKQHKCAFCSYFSRLKSNVNKHMLRSHLRIYSNAKSFTCKLCNRPFPSRITLIKHIQIHIADKPYVCSTCFKSFKQKAGLTHHTERCVVNVENK